MWKIRRGHETPLGILCTIILLDVKVKDEEKVITDSSTLSTLYGCAITKFMNFASSFSMSRGSMYSIANKLGIDSFLVDLRHIVSHGREMPGLEVFRQSNLMCMEWIKNFYWDKEVQNVTDVTMKELNYDSEMEAKLEDIFPFYDLFVDFTHRNIKDFSELENTNEGKTRWPQVKKFMKEKNFTNFRQALKHFTSQLILIIESRSMRTNYKTFFHSLVTKCEYFMNAHQNTEEISREDEEDDEEIFITPMKKPKKVEKQSVVNVLQDLIWHIAKNDYLKQFLDVLYKINFNRGETPARRQSARFWILILLRSYHYYVKYCNFNKSSVVEQKKITLEIKNIYSYQLDADLRNVIIFVGTQMPATSLKYSKEFVLHLLQRSTNDDYGICVSLLPLVYPQLNPEQIQSMRDLVDIKMSPDKRDAKTAKIYTVSDLGAPSDEHSTSIWELAEGDIDWSSLPIGYEFTM